MPNPSAKTRKPELGRLGIMNRLLYIAMLTGTDKLIAGRKRSEEMISRLVLAHKLFRKNRLGDVHSIQSDGPERFHIDDIVRWNTDCLPAALPEMKEKYGKGPFTVVAVRLHTFKARLQSGGHSEAVTIEYNGDQRVEMSGDWFTKR